MEALEISVLKWKLRGYDEDVKIRVELDGQRFDVATVEADPSDPHGVLLVARVIA